MRDAYRFTSESVTEGHPDKMSDQISDAVLDAMIADDPMSRVACETMCTTGLVVVAGEISTKAYVDIPRIVRDTVKGIGYDRESFGFDGNTCAVITSIDEQSPDIAMGVDKAIEQRAGTGDHFDEVGAGDQGMMFGYACDETDDLMPMPIWLAHRFAHRLSEVRKAGVLPYLRPDGKTQVTIEYENGVPKRLCTVLISTQHQPGIDIETLMKPDLIEHVIRPLLPPQFADDTFEVMCNPTGNFELGGPHADCGLTGRKIIVDTYGGMARHGGGAFSGKDPTKVDRSAAYAVRNVAKNIVAAGLAKRCEVQVAYAIGVAQPVSVMVETFGTATIDEAKLPGLVAEHFDLRPAALIERLDLRRPIFKRTAAYGHFGRPERDFTWERTHEAEALRVAGVARLSGEVSAGVVVRVRPDLPGLDRTFDYLVPDGWESSPPVGSIVRMRLQGRSVRGWVLEGDVTPEVDSSKLQPLVAVSSAGPPPEVVDLCRWIAHRWCGPLPVMLRAASAPNIVDPLAPIPEMSVDAPGVIERSAFAQRVCERELGLVAWPPALDRRVLVGELLAECGSTIVVVPDAVRLSGLVHALEQTGRRVLVVSAARTDRERTLAWSMARAGQCVVVGGRTAVLAPVPDLGAIVCLDEGDQALKEERTPAWHAREVAIERARRSGARCTLVSPVPTAEAMHAAGPPARPARTDERDGWPIVNVVDQRQEEPGHGLLSTALADALRHVVDAGGRAVCVLNRKGRAGMLVCARCGEIGRCERCGAAVSEADDGLRCGRCRLERPRICQSCHHRTLKALRPGVKRLADDLAALVPGASVAHVDADVDVDKVGDAAILVGTEAVLHRVGPRAKVTLVAYLDFDQELLATRARAAEQAAWLLVRGARLVGGRSGGGRLLVQTRLPDHPAIEAARQANPELVALLELARRRDLSFPPFGALAELRGDEEAVDRAVSLLEDAPAISVLGPVAGLKGSRALVRGPDADVLADVLAMVVPAARQVARLRVEVDPIRA